MQDDEKLSSYATYLKFPEIAPRSGELGTEAVAAPLLLSAGYFQLRGRMRAYVQSWMPLATILAATMTYSGLLPWWTQHIIAPFLLAFSINHLSEAPVFFRKCLALS